MKKQLWMKRGQSVRALGYSGKITKLVVSPIFDWVYYVRVRLEGETFSRNFHASDVNPTL